ncbi:hypothetical protein GHT06_021117 [Daphnia sinensis]|uniref:Uncharacterized protein n=1 Tax=Daphnia sinensis TaxID=1820382 RepID=A0AAD5KIP9_9CRUS|nr:hypothetical protein GHT06_021117 [Daphnia sinensis]
MNILNSLKINVKFAEFTVACLKETYIMLKNYSKSKFIEPNNTKIYTRSRYDSWLSCRASAWNAEGLGFKPLESRK